MPVLTAHVLNGTHIVPAEAPFLFPDGKPNISVAALLTGLFPFSVPSPQFSYAQLSFLWLWSIPLVGFSALANFGHFNHIVNAAAILHIQFEWFIIGFILELSCVHSGLLSSFGGLLLYSLMFGLPGIRGTFLATSVIGAWGDVLMPVLLIQQKHHLLAFGGIAHFVNAYVAFHGFVQYTDFRVTLTIQLLFAAAHALFTVAGVFQDSNVGRGHIHLDEEVPPTKIPVKTFIWLALIALVLSLLASIPVNFWPRP